MIQWALFTDHFLSCFPEAGMIQFPTGDFLDERKSRDFLMRLSHPDRKTAQCLSRKETS